MKNCSSQEDTPALYISYFGKGDSFAIYLGDKKYLGLAHGLKSSAVSFNGIHCFQVRTMYLHEVFFIFTYYKN